MQIDVEKLALEAGFKVRHGFVRVQHSNGSFVVVDEELSHFAALVLESAAVQCEEMAFVAAGQWRMNTAADCDRCADSIRAMKPGESNE
jgi:hypothetical protein